MVEVEQPELVRDPVCGMMIEPQDAVSHQEYRGQTYYFCNPSCAERFAGKPEQYLNPAAVAPDSEVHAGVEYICPMDPEVHKIGPGACPKCGMALEPAAPTAPPTRTEYSCPMHPQIVRSEPSNCPICGMALEPREITAEAVNPEMADMTRRFWISVALAVPLLALMVSGLFLQCLYSICCPHEYGPGSSSF